MTPDEFKEKHAQYKPLIIFWPSDAERFRGLNAITVDRTTPWTIRLDTKGEGTTSPMFSGVEVSGPTWDAAVILAETALYIWLDYCERMNKLHEELKTWRPDLQFEVFIQPWKEKGNEAPSGTSGTEH